MTREQAHQIDPQKRYSFYMYYGGKPVNGLWVETHEDPFYYIVTDLSGWKEAGQSRNQEALEKYGKRVQREGIKDWELLDKQAQNYIIPQHNERMNGNIKAKKLVIFGAGASYDYDYTNIKDKKELGNEWCPPLGDGLFDKRFSSIYNNFPGVRSLLHDLRRATGFENIGIEEYFQQQWERIEQEHIPARLWNLINVQYYLCHLSRHLSEKNRESESNNYYAFIQGADAYINRPHRRALFITFNYETLLEDAVSGTYNTEITNIDDYILNENFIIIKPHGSCNWGRQLENSTADFYGEKTIPGTASWIYDNNIDLFDITYRMLNNDSEIRLIGPDYKRIGGTNTLDKSENDVFPTLLIPYHSKDEFRLPSRHEHYLNHYIDDVEEVLVVGWKANEKRFIDLLNNRLATKGVDLTVVDPDPGSVKSKLEETMQINPGSFKQYSSFSDFVRKGGIEEFWKEKDKPMFNDNYDVN